MKTQTLGGFAAKRKWETGFRGYDAPASANLKKKTFGRAKTREIG